MALAVLFSVITVAFGALAVDSALAGRWVIALAAAVLTAWMGSLVWSGLRKRRP